MFIRDYCDNFI